jgi:nitrogen-specific signal transduction histidine kinase
MRIYTALFITAILLAFSSAYLGLGLKNNRLASKSEVNQILLTIDQFEKTTLPLSEINLSTLYSPISFYPLFQNFSEFQLNKSTFSKSCDVILTKSNQSSLDKNIVFENFRCKKITQLPVNFFEMPPIISNEGMSFAYKAFLLSKYPFNSNEWVKSHLNYFHYTELSLLPQNSLEGHFTTISKLNTNNALEILSNQKIINLGKTILIKKDNHSTFVFSVYPFETFESFFKDHHYFIKKLVKHEDCFYEMSNMCIESDSQYIFKEYKYNSLLTFLGSTILLILIAIVLYQKIKSKEYEDEQKKHALRVLTHELRTPITNLLLLVDEINKGQLKLDQETEENFLKIESEIFRLKRLAEKSSSYLQIQDEKKLFKFEVIQIPDLNNYIDSLLEPYEEQLKLNLIKYENRIPNLKIQTDPYWFSLAFKNLIDNALKHGHPPVKIIIDYYDNIPAISISNANNNPARTIEELRQQKFNKINDGIGLGLGLTIIEKIIKEMHGEIKYINNPTTFVIIFREKK